MEERAAKPEEKAYKLTDGDGMVLLVHLNGSKYWRFLYSLLRQAQAILEKIKNMNGNRELTFVGDVSIPAKRTIHF